MRTGRWGEGLGQEDTSSRADTLDLLGRPRPDDVQKAALIFRDRSITYQELRSEVSRLSHALCENFGPGDLLAIWLPNCPELLCLYLACLKTGIVAMPLHQGMKWPELRDILQHSRAQSLVTTRALADPHLTELTALGLHKFYVIDVETTSVVATGQANADSTAKAPATHKVEAASLPHFLPTQRRDAAATFQEIPVRESPRNREPAEAAVEVVAAPGDIPSAMAEQRGSRPVPVLVLHTSGSNGRAKGVMLSRKNLDHILEYRLIHTRLTTDSVSVVASCLTQSVGFYQSLALLAAGGTLILLESYDLEPMAASINRHQPTHLIMVVDAFDRLLHHPGITQQNFSRLVFASTGADRVTARVQARFIALTGRPLRVSYGLTESSWALINPGDQMDKCLALGQPCPGIEISVLGSDGREAPCGEIGEIRIKSPRTMLGYLHDEELSRAAFSDDWLLSGDLAYRDAAGWFWFAGRKKHLIVLSSGDNVSPLEVENVILNHPSVANCAVVGIPTPHGSEVPWAAVTRLDETLSEAALDAFLRERISDYKIPQKIVFLPELPVGRSGKVNRAEARKSLLAAL